MLNSTSSRSFTRIDCPMLSPTSDYLDNIILLCDSYKSAAIGGLAHLVNFRGTDTLPALILARKFYNCPMAGSSIPATEHR
ncbi:Nicotinamide phosphoribosyltransferase [Fasciolopsis buskii]|uniref:Nicotinamide phosphoribosyltransferase n=1 Tax=Fasciolopsis buskii TaxID=27845 RepID=A0A8E0VG38_9TREM|nr:Nicotinamide phosphoribosyltransferase [Fasciolopsis buski]